MEEADGGDIKVNFDSKRCATMILMDLVSKSGRGKFIIFDRTFCSKGSSGGKVAGEKCDKRSAMIWTKYGVITSTSMRDSS